MNFVDLWSRDILLIYFSHTLLLLKLNAILRMRMGHYIGIPTSRVSVFKLGQVFALFSQMTQWRLAKSSIVIILERQGSLLLIASIHYPLAHPFAKLLF